MFDGADFPGSLDEEKFNLWLENGRAGKIKYNFLLIVWDEYELQYRPVYAGSRDEFNQYERYRTSVGRESLVAVYDLYSESRIM